MQSVIAYMKNHWSIKKTISHFGCLPKVFTIVVDHVTKVARLSPSLNLACQSHDKVADKLVDAVILVKIEYHPIVLLTNL